MHVVAEHLTEDALELFLHIAHPRRPERHLLIGLEAGYGETVFHLRHLGLRLHVFDGPEGFSGVGIPDLLAAFGEHLEDHPVADAVYAAAVYYDFVVVKNLRYFALDRHAVKHLRRL